METGYMREFVVLAETCNFQETADSTNISQSSLSKHVKKIEEELGVPLFDRTTRSVKLNKYGTAFYEHARQIVKLCDECGVAINDLRISDDSKLSIGFLAMLGQYGIIEMLSEFSQSHPQISLSMFESNNPKELLRSKKCDFVFAAEDSRDDVDIKNLLYMVDTLDLVAVFPLKHPLAKQKTVTVDQLRGQNFVMHSDISGGVSMEFRYFQELCMADGFEPNVVTAISFRSTIIKMVSQGVGVAVMNRMHTPTIANYRVAVVDINPFVPISIYALHMKDSKMSTAAADFLRHIKALGSQ